jgi:hypothetical protein
MKIILIETPRHLTQSFKNYFSHYDIITKTYASLSESDLDADVWIFTLQPNKHTFLNQFQFISALIDKFEGKLCIVDVLDNGMCPSVYRKYQNIYDRAYCAFLHTDTDFTRSTFRKRILFPKFTIDYLPPSQIEKNKVVYFRGSLTGGTKLNGKNHRIEALRKLEQINCDWSDCKLSVTPELLQHNVVKKLMEDEQTKIYIQSLPQSIILHPRDYIKHLGCSTSSLCLPGNAIWCYRHLESMALDCNIISLSIDYDPGFWIGRDELDDCFNLLDFDLSNLKDVCEYSLSDDNYLREKRKYALDVYQRVFELTPNNIYKPAVWKCIQEKMQKYSIIT